MLNPSINALPLHKTHSHDEIFSSSYLVSKIHKSASTLTTVLSRRPARPAHSLFSSHTDGDLVCMAHIGVCYGMSETHGCLGRGVWRGLRRGTQPIRRGARRGWGHSGGVRRLRKLVWGQGHTLRGVRAAGEALGSVVSTRYSVTLPGNLGPCLGFLTWKMGVSESPPQCRGEAGEPGSRQVLRMPQARHLHTTAHGRHTIRRR